MSIESLLLAGISALSSVLVFISRLLWSEVKDCKTDRLALREEIESVKEEVGELRGTQKAYQACPAQACPFKPLKTYEPTR